MTRLDVVDKEYAWYLLTERNKYKYIEIALRETNYFRRYKDMVCFMNDDECIDLFKGVTLYYYKAKKNNYIDTPINLFDNLLDWHRLKFSTQRMLYLTTKNKEELDYKMNRFLLNESVEYDSIMASLLCYFMR